MEDSSSSTPIPLAAVKTWHEANPCSRAPSSVAATDSSSSPPPPPAFPVDAALNAKISLWNGAIWRLRVDAISNSTNEALKDTSGLCRKILDAAGKEVWVECEAAGGCRTGEAVVTRGCQLPAKHIIHTVGPRYNIKYVNAAENALHMCYRSSLSVAKEERIRTLAFSCVYTKRKGYPRDEAAHIASRTVRRFLEHYRADFDRVIFCVDTLEDQMIYESILPLYFPRTREDECKQATRLALRDLGNEFGEPIIEERKIRIQPLGTRERATNNQAEHGGDADHGDEDSTDDEETAIQDFREMSIDPDTERLERLRQLQEEREKLALKAQAAIKKTPLVNYQMALSKAKREDFEDLRRLKFLYNGGVDRSGSPVIVYQGANLPVDDVDLDRVALFVIQSMDAVVEKQYSVLYIHAGVTDENQPNAAWLKRLFKIFSSKYQANLRFFYMLEPTIWLKLLIFVSKGFVNSAFYKKIVYLASSKDIDNIADSLELPPHIYQKKQEPTSHETNDSKNNQSDHQNAEAEPSNQSGNEAVL